MARNKAFRLLKTSRKSQARLGRLTTAHGNIPTPFFMPIATRGSVRALEISSMRGLGAHIILSNTYHLWLRPGLSVIQKAGDLHDFMGWQGPILTDSGGYQVFSLAKHRVLSRRGVRFRDTVDGSKHFLTPERALDIQSRLGTDIAMLLDVCPPFHSSRAEIERSIALTTHWAERSTKVKRTQGQLRFAIVQGAGEKDLRIAHAQTLREMPFDGFAIGGLAVGETAKEMYRVLEWTVPELPQDSAHYLMGVGPPEQIVEAVQQGVDMFDCVVPTRNARHGSLFVWKRDELRGKFYEVLKIANAKYKSDLRPIDTSCDCATCQTTTRAYIRHLFATEDPLAQRLCTIHNVRFYLRLMEKIRAQIRLGQL
ncbi:MAG: tRNA guanosine(34) transglycosylase Tgt [Candidatus Nomurabacteria bacterium]|nr:MAG: tRNA guanosine(34) transglycosylase Tgt [Candidatus Nomurabacteria bacterium]